MRASLREGSCASRSVSPDAGGGPGALLDAQATVRRKDGRADGEEAAVGVEDAIVGIGGGGDGGVGIGEEPVVGEGVIPLPPVGAVDTEVGVGVGAGVATFAAVVLDGGDAGGGDGGVVVWGEFNAYQLVAAARGVGGVAGDDGGVVAIRSKFPYEGALILGVSRCGADGVAAVEVAVRAIARYAAAADGVVGGGGGAVGSVAGG